MEILTNLYLFENQPIIYAFLKPIVLLLKTIGFEPQKSLFCDAK